MHTVKSFLSGFAKYAHANPWKVGLVSAGVFIVSAYLQRAKLKSAILNFTSVMKYQELMSVILKHESKGYDDHNYYTGNKLNSYVKYLFGTPYRGLKDVLTNTTLKDIRLMQNANRFNPLGQLWAVGRYQIIPPTMFDIAAKAGLKDTDKFTPENQDKLGMYLLLNKRPNLGAYLKGTVPDTDANLKAAAMDVAMEWSSVGVPYPINGKPVNSSYYGHLGEKASTKTEDVQKALKQARQGV